MLILLKTAKLTKTTKHAKRHFWLNHFEDQTVGEALLDRLVHRAHVFNLKGQSMRKRRGKQVLES